MYQTTCPRWLLGRPSLKKTTSTYCVNANSSHAPANTAAGGHQRDKEAQTAQPSPGRPYHQTSSCRVAFPLIA
jgi:hypothetical protein